MPHRTGLAFLLTLATGCCAAAEPHGAGAAGLKPFELGGYVETKLTHYDLNRDGAFYRVDFAGRPQRGTLDRASATFRLTGRARAEEWLFSFRTRSEVESDQLAHDSGNRLEELSASWKPRPGFSLDAGKIVMRWGKGHTWNPVAFVERPKDPSDPRQPREGYVLAAASASRSFPGALQSVALTAVLLPVSENVNSDFGRTGHLNAAARLELQYRDTEFNFYLLNNGSRSGRLGADFSHDVTDDLELYGEWARISEQDFRLTTPAGARSTRREAAASYLGGARFRLRPASFIVELHHNGTGYSTDEFRDFVALAGNAAQAGAGTALMTRAQALADGGFGRTKPMRDYLYFRASWAGHPFTPSVRLTANLQDRSYSIAPELLYSIRNRWGLRARVTLLNGGAGTEYGEKYYSRRAELRLHFHF